MSIKYYRLAKGEELPDEFCAVRDVGGEPSEYVFYVPEAENAKLRKLAKLTVFIIEAMESVTSWRFEGNGKVIDSAYLWDKLRELGVEVDG